MKPRAEPREPDPLAQCELRARRFTSWDVVYERMNEDIVLVFADKAKADGAWAKLDGDSVYGGVYRRSVRR